MILLEPVGCRIADQDVILFGIVEDLTDLISDEFRIIPRIACVTSTSRTVRGSIVA